MPNPCPQSLTTCSSRALPPVVTLRGTAPVRTVSESGPRLNQNSASPIYMRSLVYCSIIVGSSIKTVVPVHRRSVVANMRYVIGATLLALALLACPSEATRAEGTVLLNWKSTWKNVPKDPQTWDPDNPGDVTMLVDVPYWSSWQAGSDPCTGGTDGGPWYGVDCTDNNGRETANVQGLTLDNPTVESVVVKNGKGVITSYRLNDKLAFTLGAGLTGLKQLKYLSISNLPLATGGLPASYKTLGLLRLEISNTGMSGDTKTALPVSTFSKLLELYIDNNKFTGILPALPQQLERVQFTNERLLTGAFPTFANMPSLTAIELGNLQGLAGTWPTTWGALPALQDLIVHSMRGLTGDLSKIALPANIGKLDLDSIPKLTGAWPSAVNNKLKKMYQISISNLPLTGSVPAALPASLNSLSLNKLPKLAGKWQAGWSGLKQLQELAITNNPGFTGALPELAQLPPNVVSLDLSGNGLAGPLPASWSSKGALAGLRTVALFGNTGLKGAIPSQWSASTSPLYYNEDLGAIGPDLFLKPSTAVCGIVKNLNALEYVPKTPNSPKTLKTLGTCSRKLL